jgi:outer membrane receptor protein involved in Fe transport
MKRMFILLVPILLMAGVVGKITGTVTDGETDEPLCGVDVMLSDFGLGGATDVEGRYCILNVPPGNYDVEVSMIGYRSEIKKGVRVFADRTLYLDFKILPTVIPITEPIVVIAKKPVIEIDMTSKEARVTRTEIDMLPIEKVDEAITLQGGVTKDAGGDIHIRGGRSGELAYYVDGVKISNALFGTTPFLHKGLVSEMSLLSGTFNAEYGNIMSGVVNIVTPEGGSHFRGDLEYVSYMVNPSVYRKADWIDSASDAHRDSSGVSLYNVPDVAEENNVPFLGEINGSIEGPFPFDKKSRFFACGHYLNQNSYLPFGYELERSLNGKFTRRFGSNFKTFVDVYYDQGERQNYSHLYKYLHENYLVNFTTNVRAVVGVNHAPAPLFFYNIRVGYLEETIETKPPDLSADTIIEPVTDNYSEFYISGYPIFRQYAVTKQYVFKTDVNLQLFRIHAFKCGIEHNLYDFRYDSRQQLFARGPIVHQDYQRNPFDGAVFVQDKIEHNLLVINAGLRFDYYDPKTTMWKDIEDPASAVTDIPVKYHISPRLGLSHPITDNAMLHFAYGHFYQIPPYEIMYFNAHYIAYPESIPRYGLVGNPSIEPQTTVAYEVGIKYAFGEYHGVDVTLFLKDIRNLLATSEVRVFPYDYIIYTNEDFGSVQGIDITVKRELHSHIGFTVNYTYQVARGNRSFAMQGFYDVYTGMPERIKEYYLDFDRRHTLASTVEIQTNSRSGIGVNLQATSGLPYTPYISEGVVVEENSARMGWEYSLDIMVHQGFKIRGAAVDLFVKCTNITDHINPRYVYQKSGQPWDTGEEAGGLMGSDDYIMDPSNVGPRRVVKAGIRVSVQ